MTEQICSAGARVVVANHDKTVLIAYQPPQLPITPPSALRTTTVDDRGRPPGV
jgi:hypothetical protein